MGSNQKEEAIQKAKELVELKPIYLDTETTGFGQDDEVVDISVVAHDGAILIDTLVKPQKRIPLDATRIHSITNELVKDAPAWIEIWPELQSIFAYKLVGIYNAEFDIRLMRQSLAIFDVRWSPGFAEDFCIMNLYAKYYGEWSDYHKSHTWQSLEKAARQSRIMLPNTHRAKDDASLARAVLHHMAGID